MMNKPTTLSRRRFLKYTGFGLVLTPLLVRRLDAEVPEKLSEDDPSAKALGYRHDATEVDVGKYPRSAPTEGVRPVCANCALYQAAADDPWGGCAIFPGKQVAGAGWCNAWAPKPGS